MPASAVNTFGTISTVEMFMQLYEHIENALMKNDRNFHCDEPEGTAN